MGSYRFADLSQLGIVRRRRRIAESQKRLFDLPIDWFVRRSVNLLYINANRITYVLGMSRDSDETVSSHFIVKIL